MGHPALKLEGRRFGSITIIRLEKGGWWVRCDCGREYQMARSNFHGVNAVRVRRCRECEKADPARRAQQRAWAYSGLYRKASP